MKNLWIVSGKPKNPAGSGGGSGGKKDGKEWWQEFLEANQQNIMLFSGAALFGSYIIMRSSSPSKEINWQEFRIGYLEKGEVDRVVIANKSTARIYLKGNPTQACILLTLSFCFIHNISALKLLRS